MVVDGEAPGTTSTWLLRLWVALAFLVVAAMVTLALALSKSAAPTVGLAGAAILAGILAAACLLHVRLTRPLDRLGLDLLVIARDNPDHALRIGERHWLGRLAPAVALLRQRLQRAGQDAAAALAQATASAEEQKRRLEAILLDLSEGTIVCNLQHQVLLYNQAAAALVDPPLALGLGRSVFAALTQEPVQYALDRLRYRPHGNASPTGDRFVCSTADGRRLLQARLGFVLDKEREPEGYVLALRDVSGEASGAARRDDLLQLATEGLRAPLANLRAAAETVAQHPDLPREQQAAFQQVLLAESATLSDRLETLVRGYRELGGGQWLMAEIHSSDLLASLQRRRAGQPPQLTAVGLPSWLYCDSLSLLVLLEHLLNRLHAETGIAAFDMAVSRADRRVYLDIVWAGSPVTAGAIERWLDRPLVGGLGALTGRAVLQRHGSELWSQAGRPGEAMLRLPLPSAEPVVMPHGRPRPVRPEFYDFDLLQRPLPTGALAQRPLRQITYVVLDLETTGLRPSDGDEIVELGAVRVVNGRVLTMETFERVINPNRPIPKESVAFHGITDAMAADKPPLAQVLPPFQRFAADCVLVAHNAAFDFKFLEKGAAACGLRFEQPILDTLLMSSFIDPGETDHSLDAIAARLGLGFTRRHSALGDALVTAAILVRQIERLEERGITGLAELLNATNMTAHIRAQQHHF